MQTNCSLTQNLWKPLSEPIAMYIGILWQVKIGDQVWGSFVDTALASAMAVKKARLSQELQPQDVAVKPCFIQG